MNTAMRKEEKGFTLIELLIVIGIIGFLAAAVLVAVDPVKRIQDARDARRYSEANALLNAVLTKQVDDRALFAGPANAPVITSATNAQVIVSSSSGVVCNAAATRPGCQKTMDTTTANTACVVNLGDITVAGTATSSAAVVTGVGTAFTTTLRVGDVLTSASGGTCTVSILTSATVLTCTSTPSPAFAGAYTATYTSSPLAPNYIASIPVDPRGSGTPCATGSGCTTVGDLGLGATNSGYYLQRTNGNRIEIGACSPEQAASISVKR